MDLHTLALAAIAVALSVGAIASFRIALSAELNEWTDSHLAILADRNDRNRGQ